MTIPRGVPRPRLGVSSCLLGRAVRYNGAHKRNDFIVNTLAPFIDLVPVCPELEAGLGVPREPMRLVRTADGIRLLTVDTAIDHTDAVTGWSTGRLRQLARESLDGFVLKKDSPSCGLGHVKVYGAGAAPTNDGQGLFAAALSRAFPLMPIEEEAQLSDAPLRENFVERVFGHHRLRTLFRPRWSIGDLVGFHAAHKLTLLAHEPAAYQRLGRLVANASTRNRGELREEYSGGFMSALRGIPTRGRHINVLEHMLGYFTRTLDAESRNELRASIARYHDGEVPLSVPLTRFAAHIRRAGISYLADQVYLQPYPAALMPRDQQ